MNDIAGWIAPAATMIAAMMTAANLGTRVTGWGFVVFLIGSIAWIVVAVATGQNNLLLANGFLTLVNAVGIWRWLGRQAGYDKGAREAAAASEKHDVPTLFPLTAMTGWPVRDRNGKSIAAVVEVMAEQQSGRVAYIVARESEGMVAGELSQTLHAVPWTSIRVTDQAITLDMTREAFMRLRKLEEGNWPAATRDPAISR